MKNKSHMTKFHNAERFKYEEKCWLYWMHKSFSELKNHFWNDIFNNLN